MEWTTMAALYAADVHQMYAVLWSLRFIYPTILQFIMI